MKSLFTFFSLFFILSCASQKEKTANSGKKVVINNEALNIIYEARSRGTLKVVKLLDNNITYKTNGATTNYILSTAEKNDIHDALTTLNLDNIKHLKSPTNKRMFDGALHAIIKISTDGKNYTSSNFDEGHPPKELEPLMNLLLKRLQ